MLRCKYFAGFIIFRTTTMRKIFFAVASGIMLSGMVAACSTQNHEPEPAAPEGSEHAVTAQAPIDGGSLDSGVQEPAEAGFALMRSEQLGPLRLGLSADEVLQALGKPVEKSDRGVWAADGAEHQSWRYVAQGIVLGMIAEGADNEQYVDAITISIPCRFETTKHIGIGSSRGEVLEAYRNEIAQSSGDSAVGSSDETVIAGSVYGGVVFTIEHDRVSGIFIGAGAE